MMDPPWQLATANPTRGVALGYSQLTDQDIVNLPIPKLQTDGFLFVWVINAKYKFTLDLFDRWGYGCASAAMRACSAPVAKLCLPLWQCRTVIFCKCMAKHE